MEDRISQLPQHILQNRILSLLPQKDAVQTCALSKSWRHLGPTPPKFEFHRSCFQGNEKFLSAVENTLQRYDDQKLSMQEFILELTLPDCWSKESISLLEKWIPIVIMKMGVKTFKLIRAHRFSLPSVVFQAEFLEELCLTGCQLDQIKNCIVNLQALKSLELYEINIVEESFEKIMSGCALIEHLVLHFCGVLSSAIVHKAPNLKHVKFINANTGARFEINDAPNLETICILSFQRFDLHINYFCPRLKSLTLQGDFKVYAPHHMRMQSACELSNSESNIRFGFNWRD